MEPTEPEPQDCFWDIPLAERPRGGGGPSSQDVEAGGGPRRTSGVFGLMEGSAGRARGRRRALEGGRRHPSRTARLSCLLADHGLVLRRTTMGRAKTGHRTARLARLVQNEPGGRFPTNSARDCCTTAPRPRASYAHTACRAGSTARARFRPCRPSAAASVAAPVSPRVSSTRLVGPEATAHDVVEMVLQVLLGPSRECSAAVTLRCVTPNSRRSIVVGRKGLFVILARRRW